MRLAQEAMYIFTYRMCIYSWGFELGLDSVPQPETGPAVSGASQLARQSWAHYASYTARCSRIAISFVPALPFGSPNIFGKRENE
jgi:hypothetical protein